MKNLSLKPELHLHIPNPPSASFAKLSVSCRKSLKHPPSKFTLTLREQTPIRAINLNLKRHPSMKPQNGHSKIVIMGAVSVGILVALLSGMDEQKAWALGPEGPLVEEFWDNVRRYGLYALTVSTGALYTIFRPIVDLLKNPISAILILALFGGSFYLVSQVLSAMFGVSDFTYDFGY
ncbi:uncharacterized protein LOC113846575 [Abrus precatorius]|uniref:Uncharacterized protein ycf33 n=1 Tax=Abrus precatorius TaxID=3816 RepID=A0A8B8JHV3_ABRPR|nr:uncharacterized protein LOC113846575 [Abrus precatorius]